MNSDASSVAGARAPCSELERVLRKYERREEERCGPSEGELRDLVPVGEGHFIALLPRTGDLELWVPGPDGSFGAGPATALVWPPFIKSTFIVGLGNRRVLAYDQRSSSVVLYALDLNARAGTHPLNPQLSRGALPRAPVGRDLLALDPDHLLAWIPGDGSYQVYAIDHENERTVPLVPTAFSGKRAELRRGHKLVALDGAHLLEWVPRTGEYRVWGVSYAAGAGDPLTGPLASGRWTEVGMDHELMVIDQHRLLIWNRRTGDLERRTFEPSMEDPLAGPSLGTQRYARLRSLPQGWEKTPSSAIKRVVIVFQRGRSFDLYFGRYCRAPAGSAPTCTEGPECCEAMPASTPGASACLPFDATTDNFKPNDSVACLSDSIHEGAMDRFVSSSVMGCGDSRRFACVGAEGLAGPIAAYHQLAAKGALADRFFQSTLLGDEVNLLFFAHAGTSNGIAQESGEQITSLLAGANVAWSLYLGDPINGLFGQEGPDFYDSRWSHFRFMDELHYDIETQQLGPISVVIAPEPLSEQPGAGPPAAGVQMVKELADALEASPRYKDETLLLVTYTTAGSYYDHVAPPPPPASEPGALPYGPRVPLLALGPFVQPGTVSHAPMEMSSLTKFLEWNWLDGRTGQFLGRDVTASGIGSLLSPMLSGPVAVP